MRILTLFLALFLTLLPESVSCVNIFYGQDVYLEEVCDVEEEEAIIRFSQRTTEKVPALTSTVSTDLRPVSIPAPLYHPLHLYFESLWLTACMLRL